MPTAILQPATAFNFTITMWDVEGPTLRGSSTSASPAAAAAGAVLNAGSQLLFGAFSECSGLNAEIEVETYTQGGQHANPQRFFKGASFPNLSLKRGISPNTDLWDWQAQVANAQRTTRIRKDGLVILFDRGGLNLAGAGLPGIDRLPVAAWYFRRGLPVKLQGPQLDATANRLAIETLEIGHEGLQRVSLGMIPGLGDLAASLGGVGGALGAVGVGVAAAGAALL